MGDSNCLGCIREWFYGRFLQSLARFPESHVQMVVELLEHIARYSPFSIERLFNEVGSIASCFDRSRFARRVDGLR
jgi:hypothetical protein